MSDDSFTGYSRRRTTSRGVRFAERASRALITAGGLGTILAVALILVFLVSVVAPLFGEGDTGPRRDLAGRPDAGETVRLAVDEYRSLALRVLRAGRVQAWRLDTGETIADLPVGEGAPAVTAWSFGNHGDDCAFGFADGTVRTGRLGFASRFLAPADLTDEDLALAEGGRRLRDGGIAERLPGPRWRLVTPHVTLDAPVALAGSPIRLLDHAVTGTGTVFAALDEAGDLSVHTTRERKDLLTGKVRTTVNRCGLPYQPSPDGDRPTRLLLSGVGDMVFLAWPDGRLVRYDARDRDAPRVAETLDLVEHPDRRLTTLAWHLGRTTLVAGDDRGQVRAWFAVKRPGETTCDGARLVPAHQLPAPASALTAAAPSSRQRLFALGFADGSVEVTYVTNAKRVVEARAPAGPVLAVAISPKDDALVALTPGGVHVWEFDAGHPEATLGSLFGTVWYEGYPAPAHVWQSSSGTDDFEPKLGLMPLVFGTVKATLYSMLFGVPLALLAALFTSEFLHPRVRTSVKSTIEIMASLPSVVLGFLSALVIAPFVQGVVPAVLAVFVTVPLCLLLGAYLWQLLPTAALLRLGGGARFLAVLLFALPAGLWAARGLGAYAEGRIFAGDFAEWLDRKRGDGAGGWLLILLPFAALVTMVAMSRVVTPWVRSRTASWSRLQCALLDLGRFAAGVAATFLVVWGLAEGLDGLGLDPRGGVLDTYVQRNALVVGFVMGFAIIPIIYTLAEDALTSVPRHLREASLGAGATPWQTAVRVIVPTAMSGLFSAVMIGLGRAVGETMIVLMAAGNTPVMEWNPFNGFRTLSANIATEMPEAVRDSTHYRTLFLAAFALFAMTFVLNTVAERVRQRFRKRAFQL